MPTKKKNVKKSVRAVSAKRASRRKRTTVPSEPDGVYFLKIVIYVVLGTLWLKFGQPLQLGGFELYAIPLGLIIGVMIVNHDKFQVDRKIGYAILLVVTVMSYFLPAGIVI